MVYALINKLMLKLKDTFLDPRDALGKDIVHLFVFCGFAVAQPIYDIIGQYPDFLVAHTAQPIDIVFLVILVSVALPATLGVAEWIAHFIHRRVQQMVHYAFVGMLIMLTVLPLLKKAVALPAIGIIAASVMIVTGALLIYIASSAVRQMMTYAVAAALVFPLYFVFLSPVRQIVFPHPPVKGDVQPIEIRSDAPPIIFIIFDELPLVSLLDEKHKIDPIRYPHFAHLAENAHWFRNFTSNAPDTVWSLASILTGTYPKEKRLLTLEAYPQSLFTLLGASYDIEPFGSLLLEMCPAKYITTLDKMPMSRRLKYMLQDISMVYLHIVLPPSFASKLPSVSDNWRDFVIPGLVTKGDRDTFDNYRETDRRVFFKRFINAIKPSSRPTLYIMKTMFLHNPWQFLPSGKQYSSFSVPGYEKDRTYVQEQSGFGGKRWSRNEWLVMQGYQRHLLELGAVDTVLGEVINHLKGLNMYDASMVVVMADHGCSFEPNARNRGHEGTVEADTMPVPFIIKLPHQRIGSISDENMEAVDVLPTIADVLHTAVPWIVDGQSAFDASRPRRKEKTLFFEDVKYVVDAANESKYLSLRRKLAVFGSGGTKPNGYFQIGPYGHIVGKAANAYQHSEASGIKLTFNEKSLFIHVEAADQNYVPCVISGDIITDKRVTEPLHLAISVNGTIQAVTRTYHEPPSTLSQFYAIIPESALQQGKNEIEFYTISSRDGKQVRLSPIAEDRELVLEEGAIKSVYGKILFVPDAIQGTVTIIKNRQNAAVQGWVVNRKNPKNVEKVVVFVDEQAVLNITPEVPMSGGASNSTRQSKKSIFRIVTSKDVLNEAGKIRAFAIADGMASELNVEMKRRSGE